MDLNLDYNSHIESSEATFNLAQTALKNNPSIQKVIIMKRIPRYGNEIRAELTKYGNFVYHKLFEQYGSPANIILGDPKLECYGNSSSRSA